MTKRLQTDISDDLAGELSRIVKLYYKDKSEAVRDAVRKLVIEYKINGLIKEGEL